MESRAFEIARADLTVYHTSAMQNQDEYTLAVVG
jgi:hypothetical protein